MESNGGSVIKRSTQKWIKIKDWLAHIITTKNSIPILFRPERKIRPDSKEYCKTMEEVMSWRCLGSFEKESIDIS